MKLNSSSVVWGTTHNGVDACHCTHNQKVGAYFAGDIGHFVDNYKHVYNKFTPRASILTEVLDWKKYYDGYLRKISGFTKTPLVQSREKWTCTRTLRVMYVTIYEEEGTLLIEYTCTPGQAHHPRV